MIPAEERRGGGRRRRGTPGFFFRGLVFDSTGVKYWEEENSPPSAKVLLT
jgi:hypothetical protein